MTGGLVIPVVHQEITTLSTTCWAIDLALQLKRIDALPSDALAVDPPEQSMDIVLLRNLDLLTTELLGGSGRFVFHSTDYWGPFDVGCVLGDGRIVAFENKSTSLDKRGFDKFCCDVVFIRDDPRKYLEHRFDHVRDGLDYYIETARRMFAAFFLGVRADTKRSATDLVSPGAERLKMNREQFLGNFGKGNGYLDEIRHHACFQDYLQRFTDRNDVGMIVPVLFVPETQIHRVQGWVSNLPASRSAAASPPNGCSPVPTTCWRCGGGNGIVARVAGYRFFARNSVPPEERFPEWLCTSSASEFTV